MRLARKAAGLCLAAGLLVSCAHGPARDGDEGDKAPKAWWRGGRAAAPERSDARGEKLAAESFRLFRSAESVRMTRTSGAGEASLLMDRAGNCTGTYDAGPMKRAEVIVVTAQGGEGAAYVRYTAEALAEILDEAARRGPATEAKVKPRVELIRGKYLKMPDPEGKFARQCNLQVGVQSLPFETEGVEAGAPTVRHGVRVIPLTGMGEGDDTLYVAAEGAPYMRFVVVESGGEMRFSDYGEPVRAEVPPAPLVVEADDMAGGLLTA
ncbi:hypothetical protein G6045_36985 [Streptomyces sp. YC504]|uniref:Lipoprotein n=1 Tax=Streptomyces mesophilus TaxID=1775132 RepID=A0A6G4XUD8_9ACTN|nr:hypothetical protein [Streptomyces mesophilus]NGO81219.1 hypothetical protein [Streptomyces mesophilus]